MKYALIFTLNPKIAESCDWPGPIVIPVMSYKRRFCSIRFKKFKKDVYVPEIGMVIDRILNSWRVFPAGAAAISVNRIPDCLAMASKLVITWSV